MDSDPPPHPIFVWEDGRPCHIFVEATSVRERPKLVRKIVKYGGNVVNVVRDADVLLAENNTKEALELLEAWRGDKIVLGTRWVSSCISQNQLLGENLGWGGCSLDRDRLMETISVPHEDSEEDVIGEIVPQPQMKSSTRSKSKATERPSKSDSPQRRTASASATKTQARYSVDSEHIIDLSRSSPSKVSRTQHTASQSSSIRKESSPPKSGSSSPQSERSPSSSRETAQSGANILSPFLDQQFPNFNQPLNITSVGTTPQLAALYSQFSTNQLHLFQQFLMNSQLLNSQIPDQHGLNGSQQSQQQPNVSPSRLAGESREQIERSKPDDVIPTRGSVNSGDTQEQQKNITRKNKGKVRARSSSLGEVQTAIRSIPMSSKPLSVTNGPGVFLDDWGMPKNFYIMVDLKNRKDLLRIVKKNQGAIVSTMEDADYIILNTRSNQFLKVVGAVPLSKIALSPKWLEACDGERRIVDMAPFVVDVTSGAGAGAPRKRPQSRKVADEVIEYESEEDTLAARSAGSSRSPMITSPPGSLQTAGLNMRSTSRSPTPPRRIVQMQKGKNLFTPEDRKWFFDFARFKLERNPDLSITALEKLVGRKAPHHPILSWSSQWRKNWNDEMTSLRKEISRLPRQALNSSPTSSPTSPAIPSQSFNRSPHPSPLKSKESDGGSTLVHTPGIKRSPSVSDQGTQMSVHTTPPRTSSMVQSSSSGNGVHSQARAKPTPLNITPVLPVIESLPQPSPLASSPGAIRTPPIKSPLAPTTIQADLKHSSNNKSPVSNLQTSAAPRSLSSHSPLRQASAEATLPSTSSDRQSPSALFHQASAQAASMHKPSDAQLGNAPPVSPFSVPTIGNVVSQASSRTSPTHVPPDRHPDDPIIVEDFSWKRRLSIQPESDHQAKKFKVDSEGVIDVDAFSDTLESR